MRLFLCTILTCLPVLVSVSCQSGAVVDVHRLGETTSADDTVSNDTVSDDAVSDDTVSRDSGELAYELAGKTWCTNDEACSMVLLMLDGEDRNEDFEHRLAALDFKGLVDAAWNIQPDEPATKGTVAFMLCRALDIKGGLMMHLLPCRRYAYRTAVYHGLMDRGSENEPLTGPEFVGIVGRATRMIEQ